ncbi:MAG: TldD/PmbA family protein [Archangiaceae bacterium]|nr:TldD/PmbA family protein [Archangiaceae bacterium]
MPLETREAAAVVGEVLAKVKKLDRSADVRASLWSFRSANTRFARNEVTTSGEGEESELTLSVAVGKRHAQATSNQVDGAGLTALAARALALARVAPEDPEYLPVVGAQKAPAPAPTYDEATAKLPSQARAEAARVAVEAARAKGLTIAGFVSGFTGTWALGTSAGLALQYRQSLLSMSATARTSDGTGSGWAQASVLKARELDAAKLAGVACEKAALSRSPRRLEPGRYTVLLEPAAAAELVRFTHEALDARSADEGRSFFSKPGGGKRLGEQLLSERVTLVSNPTGASTPGATFDEEGLPLPGLTWVDRGVVKAFRTSRFWAKKTGGTPSGNYGGVSLVAGSDSWEQLLSGIERGVLITRFWYTNWVDPTTLTITGLTRDGTFLVEQGKVVAAVNNFRFNESVAQAFARCDGLGREAPAVGAPESRCPALRTREFNLASVSEAV